MNLSYRYYILPILITALLSWASFLIVIFKMNPPLDGASSLGLVLFFISIFFALGTTFVLLVCFSRRIALGEKTISNSDFNAAVRQGFLLSVLGVGYLGMKIIDLLTWWSGALLLALILLLEYYFSKFSSRK